MVVHLTGEIDHFTAAPLRALLASAAADGYTGLVLNTSRITFADSGFLAVLGWWARHGRRLRLANRSKAVQLLLDAAAASAGQPWPDAAEEPAAGSPPADGRSVTRVAVAAPAGRGGMRAAAS
ncbi:STAS domain-containing protein [Streptomyces sp. NPDC058611]|uniref:STAS domain-containing protein n=1 Tax=unclassified Streptomyces TaxID=2593676 RepID=UPI00364DCF5E